MKSLEALELINNGQDKDLFEIIEKDLKALEIIKEHWSYNKLGFVQVKPIAIEDANLLKEILYESRTND